MCKYNMITAEIAARQYIAAVLPKSLNDEIVFLTSILINDLYVSFISFFCQIPFLGVNQSINNTQFVYRMIMNKISKKKSVFDFKYV